MDYYLVIKKEYLDIYLLFRKDIFVIKGEKRIFER